MNGETTFTIVGLGDSITLAGRQPEEKGWMHVLGKLLQQQFPEYDFSLINSGEGGNTSREGLARISEDVLSHTPDYVLVEFGGNDAMPDPNRHVSPEEFSDNLSSIKNQIMRGTNARIVMLTFPPVIDEWHACGQHEFYKQWGGLDAFVEEYRRLTRDFSREEGCPLADIDRALRKAIDRNGAETYILPDGVHLTAEANRVVAQEVYTVLGDEIGRQGK